MKQLPMYGFMIFACAACASAPKPTETATPGDQSQAANTRADAPEIQTARAILEQFVASNPAIDEMWQRESAPLPAQKISLPTQSGESVMVNLHAVSKPSAAQTNEQQHTFAVDLGSQATLDCNYMTERADAAATLRMIGKSVAEVVPTEQQLPAAIDVNVIAGAPVISMDLGYFVEQDGGRAMGVLKASIAALPSSTLWCVHDELGYRQTVHNSVEAMITSLMKDSEARYTDQFKRRRVSVASFSGQAAGYAEEWVIQTDTGTTTIEYTSMLTSRGPGSFASEDSVDTEAADAAGYLLTQNKVSSENGELTVQIAMNRTEDGGYHAQGTLQGKPVEFDLGREQKLPGTLLEEQMLQQFVEQNSNGAQTTLHSYSPGLAPDQLMPIHFELVDGQQRQLKVEIMGLEMDLWNDGRGRFQKSVADLGAVKMQIEVKYTHPDN